MRSIHDWLNEYGESHQNPINKMIHWICVPLIMLSLMGLLWTIPTPFFNFDFRCPVKLDFLIHCFLHYFLFPFIHKDHLRHGMHRHFIGFGSALAGHI